MSHPKLDYLKRFVRQNDPKEEYKVLACIGSGTYGDVFKAVHRETRDPVAVKIMKIDLKDDVKSICQEIHTLRECRHPNIVQFYGSYLRNSKLWICMEYCGGQSMQDIYLYTRTPLEEDCIAFVSRETLQGLNFMHERGRIHRDIKGANILLTDDGRVKVADFGVAAQLNNTVGKRTTLIGTPYWMAPEVASIESRGAGYDGKCDVWGVGITAIEYAELQPPMFDLDPRKALQILGTRNYRPPTLQDRNKWSHRFHSFIKCCLVKHERRRPDAATMLTHVFVTNPALSNQLTQRLLNFKRQLEMQSKQPTQPPQLPPPLHPQQQQPASAPIQPFVAPCKPFMTQDTCSNMPSELVSAEYQPNSRPVVIMADSAKGPSSNGFVGFGEHSCPTSVGTPALPPKSSHGYSPENVVDFSQASTASTPTSLSDGQQSIQPNVVPLSVLRVGPSRSSDPTALICAPSGEAKTGGPGTVDSALGNVQLLHGSSEDLLREVMDAFEKRRSCIDPPNSQTLEPRVQVANMNPHTLEMNDLHAHSQSEDSTSAEIRVSVMMDNRKRMQPPPKQAPPYGITTPPGNFGRARSKRRAPPPPPIVSTEESLPSLSAPCLYETADNSVDLRLPSRGANQPNDLRANGDRIDGASLVVVRYERSHGPTSNLDLAGTTVDAPPRPPPPRLDSYFSPAGYPRGIGEDDRYAARLHPPDLSIGLPPTPKVHMGACFMLLFEGCPLKVNATATWVDPETRSQIILFGTNDGVYYLSLVNLADCTLELPTTKVPDTQGCHIASVIRNPYNGVKYLCGAVEKTIIVMEWYNPRSTFIEVKRVEVPKMPCPVLNFDLVIYQDQPLPLVCLGVSATSDPMHYRLHLVNLNDDSGETWSSGPLNPDDQLQVIKVVQLEYNTLLICFPTHATIVNLNGRVKSDREGWKSELHFGATVHSVVTNHRSPARGRHHLGFSDPTFCIMAANAFLSES
ncbi:unnamed protein product [Dicrocoelium dendriticum]|nr:unnamed protein product [Dicrocoelium dendriticum]